ncbi:MAG: hypothetical protein ACD_76C00142G0003 [uncultured bacterium]|nr:MAG: hypothetical protein ACD_76C00142G0003 [uncultured bacterium]HBD04955.1 hypothetical protein [Candidatus Uhrbacteria bacterium]
MTKNLNTLERTARLVLALILLIAGLFIFQDIFAKIAVFVISALFALEAILAHCWSLPKISGGKYALAGMQFVFGYIWFLGGVHKIFDPVFAEKFSQTIAFFAKDNPIKFYSDYLLNSVTANSWIYVILVSYGEAILGASLIILSALLVWSKGARLRKSAVMLSMIAMLVSAFASANFFFATHQIQGTGSLNMLMFWVATLSAYALANESRSK